MGIDGQIGGRDPSPGERFHEQWLESLPTGQWAPYIDESAQLLADGILIGDTQLTHGDFSYETGKYYREGLAESADISLDETSLPLGNHSPKDVGAVAWAFNKLYQELENSRYTDFKNPSRAIEAAINKAVVEALGHGTAHSDDLETIRLPDNATISALVSEVFCRPRSEAYLSLLLDVVNDAQTSSLLERIESPRMVTTLWEHQRTALGDWLANDCRGYVDMATATGKTILGLAAIAHHFGALHPADDELTDQGAIYDGSGRATVVVVAHRDLILDQWKREFDTHLNIPEQSSTDSGEHTVEFEWGDVHFWTPNRLSERGVPAADLVVLDETHHYLGSSGFGGILDEIDGDILALSGSLDDANARTLERRNISEVFQFSLQDGQEAGIIPRCDWDVTFSPFADHTQLTEITANCRAGQERYSSGIPVPANVDADTAQLTFENLSEARSIAQSTVGKDIKEHDEDFREFASAVMGRQLTQYNLSPDLSTIVNLVLDHVDQHKCVVLLETEEEIERVMTALESRLGEESASLITKLDSDDHISVVREFDETQEAGAILGTARTLGEGIDIQTADVCINRGRGRLSRSLVQRMGRVLRNPDGQKHAKFYHVMGVPSRDDATLAAEDGVALLETSSQLLCWGETFDAQPVFEIDAETMLTEQDLRSLEDAGATALREWTPGHYDWPTDSDVKEQLEELCEMIESTDESALLSIERADSQINDPQPDPDPTAPDEPTDIQFVAADGGGVAVPAWLYSIVQTHAHEELTVFAETAVREQTKEDWTTSSAPEVDATTTRTIELNPALEALVTAYADDRTPTQIVAQALATALLAEDVESTNDDLTLPEDDQPRLRELAGGHVE